MSLKKNRKLIVIGLVFMLVLSLLTACAPKTDESTNEENTNKSTTESETAELTSPNKVVAEVNGTEITRKMVGKKLAEAEQKAVQEYVDEFLLNEFYKEVSVEETEIEGQLAVIKAQVGEEEWDSYLQYVNQPDEESFKESIKRKIQIDKKLEEIKESIEVTEEEVQKYYEQSPKDFNVLVGDTLFAPDENTYNHYITHIDSGDTLEFIVEKDGGEIKEEHANFSFDGFNKTVEEIEVGDTIYTKPNTGTFAIMRVTRIEDTFEQVKGTVREQLVLKRAEQELDKRLQDFYQEVEVDINGEK